jgi:membrane protease YdiL (CAAX protease family)
MQDAHTLPPAPGSLRGAARVWASVALLIAALLMTVPIYGGWLAKDIEGPFRFGLAALLGTLAFVVSGNSPPKASSALVLSLFGVSLGLALAYLVDSGLRGWLGLSWHTPKGAAFAKIFAEVLPVCGAIFLAARLARLSPELLRLRGGRVRFSLVLGGLATIPLLVLFAVDPSGGRDSVLSTPVVTLRSWLPWILLFSVANAFMEELWFRGLWYGTFKQVIGEPAAIHVTSVAFCMMHVIVYWGDPVAIALLAPTWLFMGYAYALIVRRTGSLWGPVVAHSIADVLYLFIAFTTEGL